MRVETTFAGVLPAMPSAAGSPAMFSIPVGNSIFTYKAPFRMAVVITGGAVSLVTYGRAGLQIPTVLTGGLIELNAGDEVNVTWLLSKPAMTGIPR